MEFKGTKEKWIIRKQSVKGSFDIITKNTRNWFATVHSLGTIPHEESEANAKLIASATEMLEMLKDILETQEEGETFHSYKIKELIKKVTE